MKPISSKCSKLSWTDKAIINKVEELRRLCLGSEKPDFFPKNLIEFCKWTDQPKEIRAFTRPAIYKAHNNHIRNEVQNLIQAGLQRWSAASSGDRSRIRELEALTKMLSSRYHQERQHRVDAQKEVNALRASVHSLTSKIVELTGSRSVKLVSSIATREEER